MTRNMLQSLIECLDYKENDIYVRYWNKDRISNRLRITIGTDEQMDRFLEFLRSYLNN